MVGWRRQRDDEGEETSEWDYQKISGVCAIKTADQCEYIKFELT